jgi:hypothetical protein
VKQNRKKVMLEGLQQNNNIAALQKILCGIYRIFSMNGQSSHSPDSEKS